MAGTVVSIAVVGLVLVAALNTVGAARRSERTVGSRSRGLLLAEDLMSEILRQAYEDPAFGPGSFGLGFDEVGSGDRSLWDDVDDYDGWSACPPQHKDGTEIAGFAGWTRSVQVRWVNPLDLAQAAGSDTGVKRITVTVTDGQEATVSLVALRSNARRLEQERQP